MRFTLKVAEAAVPGYIVTFFGSPTQTAFCLDEVPNFSNRDPRFSQAIFSVVVQQITLAYKICLRCCF